MSAREHDAYRDQVEPVVKKLFADGPPTRDEVYDALRDMYITGYEDGDSDGYDRGQDDTYWDD